jgi:hypothetical protein
LLAPALNAPSAAPDIHELLTLEFPGLSDATCDAMGDNFNWALDQQWRSKLVAKDRFEPALPASSGSASTVIDAERIQLLDAAAEWYNAIFGPAVLGGQLWSEAQPGASNKQPLKLTKRLTGDQAARLDNYRKNVLVKSATFQHQNAMATAAAHFTVQPRLALYQGKARDFYNLLNETTDDRPSIVQFIADAAGDPGVQDAAMRLSARYAGVLAALDPSGELDQEFRLDLVAAQMAMMTLNCKFNDADDMANVLSLALLQLQQTPTGNEVLTDLKFAGSIAGQIPNLAKAIAAEFAKTAPPAASKPLTGAGIIQTAFMARLNTIKTNLLQVPAFKVSADAAPTLLLAASFGYGIYQSICAMMNVKNLKPEQAAYTIASTIQSVFQSVKKGGDIFKGALELIKGGLSAEEKAAYQAALKASMLVSKSGLGGVVKDGLKLVGTSDNIFLKQGTWFESVVKAGGRFDGEGMTMDLFFDGAEIIGKALGPLVAAAIPPGTTATVPAVTRPAPPPALREFGGAISCAPILIAMSIRTRSIRPRSIPTCISAGTVHLTFPRPAGISFAA